MNYKRILTLCLACVMLVMCFTGCAVQKSSPVIGSVNGENITADYYEYFMLNVQDEMVNQAGVSSAEEADKYWDTEIDGQKAINVLKQRTFDEVASLYLENQKAKELGITLDEADKEQITSSINNFITQVGGQSAYKQALKEMGLTDASYRSFMEMFYYAYKLEEKIQSEDAEKYTVSDDDAKAYAESEEKVRAKHILFATTNSETGEPLSDAEKQEMKKVAQEALDKIKSGEENFDDVMNSLSQDPGLSSNPDGYTFGKGEMVKEFEETAFSLEVGQMSDLVETDYGYHIIKREARTVTDEDIENAKQEMINEIYEKQIEEWKNESEIVFDKSKVEKIKPRKYATEE